MSDFVAGHLNRGPFTVAELEEVVAKGNGIVLDSADVPAILRAMKIVAALDAQKTDADEEYKRLKIRYDDVYEKQQANYDAFDTESRSELKHIRLNMSKCAGRYQEADMWTKHGETGTDE